MFLFIVLSVIFLLSWYVWDSKRYSKYPPGPLRFPIVGNLFQIVKISSHPGIAFQKLSKTHGDLVFVKIGGANTIIANSYEDIKYLRNHEFLQNRAQHMAPGVWERQFRKNIGIIFANGKDQQAIRKFTIRTLRDFGFGKAVSMDSAIQHELDKFIKHLGIKTKEVSDGVLNSDGFFDMTVLNIVWKMVTGESYDLKDEKMQRLLKLSHDVFQSINMGMDIVIAFPSLYHLLPDAMGRNKMRKNVHDLAQFFKETIAQQRQSDDYGTNPKSYLDVFLSKIEEEKGKTGETAFNDEQLVMSLIDLFAGAADTTSNTLKFALLFMALNPEVQKKAQKEMDNVLLEKDELIGISMRDRLPLTYATLLECMRHATIVPTLGAHYASEDFHYKGYLIEKGVYVIGNVYAVHFSDELWGDPYNFRPERFLTKQGIIDTEMTGYLNFFGFGSRQCLGSSVGESALFPYFASILRNFTIMKASEKEELSTVPNMGITLSPKPFRVKLVPTRSKHA